MKSSTVPSSHRNAEAASRWGLAPSMLALLLSNLIPLAGVIFWDWSVLVVMLVFWLENLVYGAFTVVKILVNRSVQGGGAGFILGKVAAAAFFSLHYGIFAAVHGVFVLVIFGGPGDSADVSMDGIRRILVEHHLSWVILALTLSHGLSFFESYIGRGEYRTDTVAEVMNAPYGRVVVMHVAILCAAMLLSLIHAPMIGVVMLVLLKTIMDARAHRKAHRRATPATHVTAPHDRLSPHGHVSRSGQTADSLRTASKRR